MMRLYDKNDMVKAGCHDCQGCSDCCRGMGDTIILDPLDVCRLTHGLQKNFEELLEGSIALHVEDSIILPHMQMVNENEHCVFLNKEERCSIHSFRPGLCRLFPLGRSYEEGKLRYFLLEDCPAQNKTKVKIEKWINMPEFAQYEQFLTDWHFFLKEFRQKAQALQAVQGENAVEAQETLRNINMYVLQVFYMLPYEKEIDFFSQFRERMLLVKDKLQI